MDDDTLKQILSLQLDLLVAMNENDDVQSWSAGIEQRADKYKQFITRMRENGTINQKALDDLELRFTKYTK